MPSLGGWEWVILFAAVVVIGIPVLVVVLVVTAVRKGKQQRPVVDPRTACQYLFDGRPVVNYQLGAGALPFEAVMTEAQDRGYRLETQQGAALVFTKAARA